MRLTRPGLCKHWGAPYRRNNCTSYPVALGSILGLTLSENWLYKQCSFVLSLSFFYTIVRLQHLIALVSVTCYPVCVNKVAVSHLVH